MRRTNNSLLILDVVGCSTVGICLLCSAWFVFVRAKEASASLRTLTQQVSAAQTDLTSIGQIMTEQSAQLDERRVQLEKTGQLPALTPIEHYSQEVLGLARRYGLRVIRQNPVDSQSYPGLLEQRYSYEMSGPTANILNFLVGIENTSFWADIGFLHLDAGHSSNQNKQGLRKAAVTVSLFSAPAGEAQGKEAG